MRTLITMLAATLLAVPLAPRAQAKEVSVEFFYETLDPYGDWLQTTEYGYVWHPKEVAEDWRPYTAGGWAYTEAGWTWVSDEPYGAITYHYGRWARVQDAGWVWVPDTDWGPAWVSWRRSDQYIGWAPLPPEATFKREVGIQSWADSYYDIGPSQYSFVSVRDFGQPTLTKVVLPRRQNVEIIRETKNITNITYSDRGVFGDGPQYDVVVRESKAPVRRLRLERREDVVFEGNRVRGESLRANIAGDSLRIFAPTVAFRGEVAPSRIARRVDRVEVDRGWRDVPQAQELRNRFQQDTPRVPASLPRQASFARAAAAAATGESATRALNAQTPAATTAPATTTTTEGARSATTSTTPGTATPNGKEPRKGSAERNVSTTDNPTATPSRGTAAPGEKSGSRKPMTAESTTGPGSSRKPAPGQTGTSDPTTPRKPLSAESNGATVSQESPNPATGSTKPEAPATRSQEPGAGKPGRTGEGRPGAERLAGSAAGERSTGDKPASSTRESRGSGDVTVPETGRKPASSTAPSTSHEGAAERPAGSPETRPGRAGAEATSPAARGNRPAAERGRETPGASAETPRSAPGAPGRPEVSTQPRPGAAASGATGATPAKSRKGDDKDKDKEKQ